MSVLFKQEFLSTCLDEVKVLIDSHREEVPLEESLDPDYEAYDVLECSGILKAFTVRFDGDLVGYAAILVSKNIHNKNKINADCSLLYLRPDFRKGLTAVNFMRFIENCMKEDGVDTLVFHTTIFKPYDSLLDYLGFGLKQRTYTKHIK